MLYQLSYFRTRRELPNESALKLLNPVWPSGWQTWWWMGKDSNLRRLLPTGLQPVPFGHLGTHPQVGTPDVELAMGLEPATC
jgi:hypothetical protein